MLILNEKEIPCKLPYKHRLETILLKSVSEVNFWDELWTRRCTILVFIIFLWKSKIESGDGVAFCKVASLRDAFWIWEWKWLEDFWKESKSNENIIGIKLVAFHLVFSCLFYHYSPLLSHNWLMKWTTIDWLRFVLDIDITLLPNSFLLIIEKNDNRN